MSIERTINLIQSGLVSEYELEMPKNLTQKQVAELTEVCVKQTVKTGQPFTEFIKGVQFYNVKGTEVKSWSHFLPKPVKRAQLQQLVL